MPVNAREQYDPTNVFARILRGEIPCRRVFENEWALAFHDLHPRAPVHVLVIPKALYVSAADFFGQAPAEAVVGFCRAVAQVAAQLGLEADGYRLLANAGGHAHQEVPHFHVHIFGGRALGPMLLEPG